MFYLDHRTLSRERGQTEGEAAHTPSLGLTVTQSGVTRTQSQTTEALHTAQRVRERIKKRATAS